MSIEVLIERARYASARFEQSARRSVVVEFAGTPKAGKTSTIAQISAFFKRCGFRVGTVVERASVCPIRDKKHFNFNVWTACTTLAQLLEKTQDPPVADDPQILILDRGIFDSLCWLRMMEHLVRVRGPDRERIEAFLRIDDWRTRMTGVVLMSARPADAMEREQGHLPVKGASGSIMNEQVLEQMRCTIDSVAEKFKTQFRILPVDTSSQRFRNEPRRTCEHIADNMLNWIEEHLQEDILAIPKSTVRTFFAEAPCVASVSASELLDRFHTEGVFRPRSDVEADGDVVQALPVVVVRNMSGHILRLRRRERTEDNPLHEELVIWAGGHVRREDADSGDAILTAAIRELHEELRLDVEQDSLKLAGAIYATGHERTSKHVAIVFEWRAKSDDVAVSLSSAEFFERRGTSLSGKFEDIDTLARDVSTEKMSEAWSVEIIRKLLGSSSGAIAADLFD